MKLQRLIPIVTMSLALFVVGGPSCKAQVAPLPPELVGNADLPQDQKDRVREFVDAHKAGLSGTATEIKRSRNALLEPLRAENVSVSFRLEYTRQLAPVLRPLIGNKSDVIAVNAVRVAGDLASATSVEMLTEALKDPRPGVRYAAAAGFEGTFQAMRRTVPALGGAQAVRAIDTLDAAMTAETDPRVLEGLALAIQEASKIPSRQVEGMRDAAVMALARSVSAKTTDRKIGSWADPAFRRAILAIRAAVTNPDINEPRLSDRTLRAAAGMAGNLLAMVSERLKSNGAGDADLALLVSEAEKTVFFISPNLNVPNPKETNLSELVQQGRGGDFQQQVMQLIGPNGVLTSPNFGFPDDHFTKPR